VHLLLFKKKQGIHKRNDFRKMKHYHIIISKRILRKITLGVFFLVSTFYTSSLIYGALSCSVTTTCNSPSVIVYRMQAVSNSHVELASGSTYAQLVCCAGGTGLANTCSGTFATVAKLSGITNAHIEQGDQSNYANSACMSVTSGTVTVGFQDTSCTGFDTIIGSISAITNGHAGGSGTYTRKICGTATAATSLTFSVDSGSQPLPSISPGTLVATSSILTIKTTNATGFNITANRSNSLATMLLNTDSSIGIPDKTNWSAPVATTTIGSATASTTEPSTLQFRIRQALTDTPNYASVWWGTDDTTVGALFSGFPVTAQTIVNRSTPAAATTTAYVLYNLNVPQTQKNGLYSGDILYSVTANP
jgi:hypothetical protein